MKRTLIFCALLLAGLMALAWFGSVSAQTPQPQTGTTVTDNQVNAVAHELYCPVCENIPLDVCPTQACAQWRELIRQQLAQGMTKQQIKDYFAKQYGDRVLDQPPLQGLNLLVYILPFSMLLIGVVVVVRVLRSGRNPVGAAAQLATAPTPHSESEDAYERRLEEELKKFK
jgi:cytochrome c-type biogenesis protein CcmH